MPRTWPRVAGSRHDPNASRSGRPGSSVRIRLGGRVVSDGQARSPFNRTSYGVAEPGSSPSIATIA